LLAQKAEGRAGLHVRKPSQGAAVAYLIFSFVTVLFAPESEKSQ